MKDKTRQVFQKIYHYKTAEGNPVYSNGRTLFLQPVKYGHLAMSVGRPFSPRLLEAYEKKLGVKLIAVDSGEQCEVICL